MCLVIIGQLGSQVVRTCGVLRARRTASLSQPAVTCAPFRAAEDAMSPARAVALRFTFALSPSRVARARTAPPHAVRRASLAVRADGKAAESGPLEERVDLRVGRVLSARKHEEAEKLVRHGSRSIDASDVCDVVVGCWVINLDARETLERMTDGWRVLYYSSRVLQYIEEIDVGEPEGPRTILSGLVPYMAAEDLVGKNVIVFANLKARLFCLGSMSSYARAPE